MYIGVYTAWPRLRKHKHSFQLVTTLVFGSGCIDVSSWTTLLKDHSAQARLPKAREKNESPPRVLLEGVFQASRSAL